jgi:hypothetical protein
MTDKKLLEASSLCQKDPNNEEKDLLWGEYFYLVGTKSLPLLFRVLE